MKSKKKGEGFFIAAVIFFALAVWLALLAAYLHKSIANYKPSPNGVQEGDMVSALLLMLFVNTAIFSLAVSLGSWLIYLFKYRRSKSV